MIKHKRAKKMEEAMQERAFESLNHLEDGQHLLVENRHPHACCSCRTRRLHVACVHPWCWEVEHILTVAADSEPLTPPGMHAGGFEVAPQMGNGPHYPETIADAGVYRDRAEHLVMKRLEHLLDRSRRELARGTGIELHADWHSCEEVGAWVARRRRDGRPMNDRARCREDDVGKSSEGVMACAAEAAHGAGRHGPHWDDGCKPF